MSGKTGRLVAKRSRLVMRLLYSDPNRVDPAQVIEQISEIDREIKNRPLIGKDETKEREDGTVLPQ